MARHKQKLRSLLINAIIELCRKESFYLEELRIEGTLCVVSDRSSALIMQITEQVGEKTTSDTDPEDTSLQLLMVAADEQSSSAYEEPSRLVANEVALEKLDQNVGSWLLGQQSDPPNPLTKEAVGGGKIEGKHQCPFCPKRYRFKHSLKDHINKHTGDRPHHCKYCSLCFMHLGSLCAHVKRRHSQYLLTEYQCRICSERFMSEQFLKQHYTWKHKGEKLTTTDVVTMMNAVRSQYVTAGGDPGKVITVAAEDQPKNFPAPQHTWNNHVGDATKTTDWNSGQSNNGMTSDAANQNSSSAVVKSEPNFVPPDESLQPRHSSGHGSSSSVQFNAPAVNMGFQQMAQTLSMFSGFPFTRGCNPLGSFAPFTPPYQQNLVTSAASSDRTKVEDSLTLHRSADGKFQCPYCEKSYNFKHTLKDHINKHLGKRPHVCKHCGDSFVHLASLCAHIKRRHDEHMPTEFRCEICHEKLMNYQSLKQHYTWRHRETRTFVEANEYSMFLNSSAADTSGAGTEKDSGQQVTNPMFFFPGQSLDGGDVTAAAANELKKQKSDAMIVTAEFDAVRALDSLLPDEYQITTSLKSTPSAAQDLGVPDSGTDKHDRHPNIFAESMLPSNETVQQMALVAEYFEEADVQTSQGIFKYKCRICGNLLKPQANLSEHLNSHYSSRKPFAEEADGMPASIGADTNALTCLGCGSKFHGTLELQHHLESNPDHLSQPWHQ